VTSLVVAGPPKVSTRSPAGAVLASPRMRRLLPLASLLVLAAAAAPAGAATLTLDRGCYLAKQPGLPNGQTITVRGDGFTPDAPVGFALGTASLGSLTANSAGALAGRFQPPGLGSTQFKSTRSLTANDGVNQAQVAVELRRLAADFLPSTGNPRTLRARFYVYGFGPLFTVAGLSTSQPVYEHVFDPTGRRRGTFLVGRTSGPCGDMRSTRRRILPFPPRNGRWTFRFTTRRSYSRRSSPQASVGFLVRTIFRPR
jgi:hypothetical protein